MEASEAGSQGPTYYLRKSDAGEPLPESWQKSELRTESGAQLYDYVGSDSPSLGDEWEAYSPETHGPAVLADEPLTEQPDTSQAPVAAEQEKAIVGDAGLGESQPSPGMASQDTPLVNATAPQAQSGVPLPEDRAAGVEPNEEMRGTVAPPHSPLGSAPAGATPAQGQPAAAEPVAE